MRLREVGFFFIGFFIQLAFVVISFRFYKQQNFGEYVEKHEVLFTNQSNSNASLIRQTLSEVLENEIKILCMIMTLPKNHEERAIHVRNTWGRRCNKLLFISSQTDENFDVVLYPFEESRNGLWNKTRWSFKHLYDNYMDEYDWFMKADDDTYLIVENLRFLLAQYDPKVALMFGHRFAVRGLEEGYMAGGGYILSKKALEKFGAVIDGDHEICRFQGVAEDWEIARCFSHSAILVDSRDEKNQKRFFPTGVEEHMRNGINEKNSTYWYTRSQYYFSPSPGTQCCSETSVQYHYINPKEMFALEYFIYNLQLFGLVDEKDDELPRKKTLEEIIKASDQPSLSLNFEKHRNYHKLEASEIF